MNSENKEDQSINIEFLEKLQKEFLETIPDLGDILESQKESKSIQAKEKEGHYIYIDTWTHSS